MSNLHLNRVLALFFVFESCTSKTPKRETEQVTSNQKKEIPIFSDSPQNPSEQEKSPEAGENPNFPTGKYETPFSSGCDQYPCYYRQNKVPSDVAISSGVSGFEATSSYEFDFSSGQPKVPNQNSLGFKAPPRTRVITLDDGRVVARENNGDIVWFKDEKPQYVVHSIKESEVKEGSNYPIGSLALLRQDIIVSANSSGDLKWYKDGQLVSEVKIENLSNILELPNNQLAVVHGNLISRYENQTPVSTLALDAQGVNSTALAFLDSETLVCSISKDSKNELKIMKDNKEVFSIPEFKTSFLKPLSSDEFVAVGVLRYRHQNNNMIYWIKGKEIVREINLEDDTFLTQPQALSDGTIIIGLRSNDTNKKDRIAFFNNGSETFNFTINYRINFDLQSPIVTSDDVLLFLNPSARMSVWKYNIMGYNTELESSDFWPPTLLPTGSLVGQTSKGLVQWFKPTHSSSGFFASSELKAPLKLRSKSGSSAICSHSAAFGSVTESEITFLKTGLSNIKLSSSKLGCTGENLTSNISGGKFTIQVANQYCRMEVSGIIDSNSKVTIAKFHRETCTPDLKVGFHWLVQELAN